MSCDAFVLAAGFGTRLRPLTLHRPKPLVPVCGVPLLSYSLALCAKHGLRRVMVNGHWMAESLACWEGEREGCVVSISVEAPDILGTGGGLRFVRDRLADRFAVLNGDVMHNVDLGALMKAVRPGGAAMALRPDPEHAQRYGIVAADETNTIVEMVSLASAEARGDVHRDTHFTGIHAMDNDALKLVPEGFACIVRSAYTQLVPQRQVGAIRYGGPWLDAGDPDAYLEANLAVLRGEHRFALDPFERAGWARRDHRVVGDASLVDGVVVSGCAWVGTTSRVARGVTLHDSVVGPGAVVGPKTSLTECVVWDDVEVPAGEHVGRIFHAT